MLLSIFSLVETITLKIWGDHCPGVRNVRFRFLLVAQKRRLPKLSNVDVKTTNWSTRTSFQCASLNSLFVSQIELTFESNKKDLFQNYLFKVVHF